MYGSRVSKDKRVLFKSCSIERHVCIYHVLLLLFFYFICKYNELMRRNEMRKIPRTTITWQNGKDTVTKRAIQRNIKAERGKEILKQSG